MDLLMRAAMTQRLTSLRPRQQRPEVLPGQVVPQLAMMSRMWRTVTHQQLLHSIVIKCTQKLSSSNVSNLISCGIPGAGRCRAVLGRAPERTIKAAGSGAEVEGLNDTPKNVDSRKSFIRSKKHDVRRPLSDRHASMKMHLRLRLTNSPWQNVRSCQKD